MQRCHLGFLIPLLTVRAATFGGNPLERPRGPRGRCGQLLRGPFRANANSAAFDARNHEPAEVNHDGPHPCRDHRFHVRGARDRRRFFGRLGTGIVAQVPEARWHRRSRVNPTQAPGYD